MSYWDKRIKAEDLLGETITKISQTDNEIFISLKNGDEYKMYHDQDCCEGVYIDDVSGYLEDLIGNPLTMAEESTNSNENPPGVDIPSYQDSFTWTFYRFATIKGYVTIRWYGGSNGYYSESVDITKTN